MSVVDICLKHPGLYYQLKDITGSELQNKRPEYSKTAYLQEQVI